MIAVETKSGFAEFPRPRQIGNRLAVNCTEIAERERLEALRQERPFDTHWIQALFLSVIVQNQVD